MKYDHIVVRYGELTLKTKNRKMFVNAIRKTMIRALEGLDVKVKANRDRAYIELFEADPYEVMEALSHVTGILSVSRSEERRVGKEGRCRGARGHEEKRARMKRSGQQRDG